MGYLGLGHGTDVDGLSGHGAEVGSIIWTWGMVQRQAMLCSKHLPVRKQVRSHGCGLYTANNRAVIFRQMQEEGAKETRQCLGAKLCIRKVPIFFKLIYSLTGAHTQNPSRLLFLF